MAVLSQGPESWDVELDGRLPVLNSILKSAFVICYWIKGVNTTKFRHCTAAPRAVWLNAPSIPRDVYADVFLMVCMDACAIFSWLLFPPSTQAPEPHVSLSSPLPPFLIPLSHIHSLCPHPVSGSHHIWLVIQLPSFTRSLCFECFSCYHGLSFETTVLVILFPRMHTSGGSPLPAGKKNWVSDTQGFSHFIHILSPSSSPATLKSQL